LLSQAKSHGNIFTATGGVHLMSNDIFKGIMLKQRRILREKLAMEKTLRQQQERTESNALTILEAAGGNATKIKGSDLTILLSWHQHPKVAGMKKEEKLSAWVAIVNRGRAPPLFEKWTDADNLKLLEAQSGVVEMAHTALWHLECWKECLDRPDPRCPSLVNTPSPRTHGHFARHQQARATSLDEEEVEFTFGW